MARCLVLGANGFLGSHLVDSLIEKGHSVRAFDRFSHGIRFNEHPRAEVFTGDFLNRHDIQEAVKDIEYVFHFISTTTPATAENDPLIDVDTNIRMSIELFDECSRQNVKKVIFASTGGAVYGESAGKGPIDEKTLPLPVSPYAIGKLTIEQYLRYYRVKYGLESVSLRISNPYGERQPLNRKQGVIPIFLERVHNQEPLTILGDGSMIRDYMYVKDVAELVSGFFESQCKEHVYNIGTGQGVTVNELVDCIEQLIGHKVDVEYKPVPATFLQSVVLNPTVFEQEFGLVPATSLKDGVRATWEYINSQSIDKE